MAAYQTVTTPRTTPTDLAGLLLALRTAVAPDVGIQVLDLQTYTLKKNTPWTPAEIAQAQTAIDTAPVRDDAALDVDQKVLKALVLGLWECIPNPTLTKAQLRARILAIWRTL